MRPLVVLNPNAHGGRAAAQQAAIASAFRAKGIDATFRCTAAPGHATDLVCGLETDAFDTVIAAGGDGTLFEIVNGLMARPPESREQLGVLPLGTGNAFSRDLGLETGDWAAGLELITGGRAMPLDVGEVSTDDDHFWFLNILGLGFVVDAATQALRLKRLGRAAYTLGALSKLVNMPRYPISLTLDGEVQDLDRLFFIEVANSRFTGTHFMMAPGAELDDGLFDVLLVRTLSRRRALRLFPTIYDGRHVDAPEVETLRAREIRIDSPRPLACAVDGEFRGTTPMTIRCLRRSLRVLGFRST